MHAILSAYKPALDAYVLNYLNTRRAEHSQINKWQDDVYTRLNQFVTQGKSIRGCLFLWALETYHGAIDTADYALAASFELIHSGFLIHDDIMDNDRDRRGNPTLHAQYERVATEAHLANPESFGKNLAICAGDLAIFLGMDCLVSTPNISSQHAAIAREYASVCIAQMQDIAFGSDTSLPTLDEVLSLYTYKTARYTIMLPLREGARMGGADTKDTDALEEIGQNIGIVFQLADDLLNLYGDQKNTGKPVGSDTRENKKTFAYISLQSSLTDHEKQRIADTHNFEEKHARIMEFMRHYAIREKVEQHCISLISECQKRISQLQISEKSKHDLSELITFVKERAS